MRDTKYATEIASADIDGHRIERLFVKSHGEEEIRFSWWKDGRMQTRPLDLPEHELLPLLEAAIHNRVFSESFLRDLDAALGDRPKDPPDDHAEDMVVEMANLDESETGLGGTIFVSTALGSHGARVKWYPGQAGRRLPCLIMSVGPEPKIRDDFLPTHVTRPVIPRLTEWVRLNYVALLTFWNEGDGWTRKDVAAFLDGLQPLPR